MGFELNFQNEMIYNSYCNQEHYCYKDFNNTSDRCLIFLLEIVYTFRMKQKNSKE